MSFFSYLFGSGTPPKGCERVQKLGGMSDWERKNQKPSFEYRVTEKRKATGELYFIGHSTNKGRLERLVECALTRSMFERDRDRYMMCGAGYSNIPNKQPVYIPRYTLIDERECISRGSLGGASVKPAELSDPCKVKEVICGLRKSKADREANLKYSKVVSVGECPCK